MNGNGMRRSGMSGASWMNGVIVSVIKISGVVEYWNQTSQHRVETKELMCEIKRQRLM
jgi:hypothetical protein